MPDGPRQPPPRRRRQEAREETRRRLLDAALSVFLERGFTAASVEEIAAQAGFTRGALYSNFADKDALFLALVDARLAAREAEIEALMGTSSPLTMVDDLRSWISDQPNDARWTRLVAEFRAHALRNEAARARLAEAERAIRAGYQRAIEAQFSALSLTPPSPEVLALVLSVLDAGIPVQQLLDPDEVPEGAFFEAINLLFRAVVALAEA